MPNDYAYLIISPDPRNFNAITPFAVANPQTFYIKFGDQTNPVNTPNRFSTCCTSNPNFYWCDIVITQPVVAAVGNAGKQLENSVIFHHVANWNANNPQVGQLLQRVANLQAPRHGPVVSANIQAAINAGAGTVPANNEHPFAKLQGRAEWYECVNNGANLRNLLGRIPQSNAVGRPGRMQFQTVAQARDYFLPWLHTA